MAGPSRPTSTACRGSVYERRQRDEDFALAWADALEEGTDALVDEATRRAMGGSDTLMIFLLKARRPEVYRERWAVEHSGEIRSRLSADDLAKHRASGSDPVLEDALARLASADAAFLRRQADAEGHLRAAHASSPPVSRRRLA